MAGFYKDEDDGSASRKILVIGLCGASLVLFSFLVILYLNLKPQSNPSAGVQTSEDTAEDEFVLGESTLTSQDLDFWNLKEEETPEAATDDPSEGTKAVFVDPNQKKSTEKTQEDSEGTKWEEGDRNDGNHIAITDENGETVWYELLDIAKTPYQAGNLTVAENRMLQYDDGTTKSQCGILVPISVKEIDWSKVAASYVKFALLTSVERNSATGWIISNPSFQTNGEKASAEKIACASVAKSAAVSEAEAIEESNYSLVSARNAGCRYPVIMDLTGFENPNGRTSNLTNEIRTKIVIAFCENVRKYNLTPMIYASKNFLITRLNMEALAPYEVCVKDLSPDAGSTAYFTEYPYVYSIWNYADYGNVSGIDTAVPLCISFTNYP